MHLPKQVIWIRHRVENTLHCSQRQVMRQAPARLEKRPSFSSLCSPPAVSALPSQSSLSGSSSSSNDFLSLIPVLGFPASKTRTLWLASGFLKPPLMKSIVDMLIPTCPSAPLSLHTPPRSTYVNLIPQSQGSVFNTEKYHSIWHSVHTNVLL